MKNVKGWAVLKSVEGWAVLKSVEWLGSVEEC